MAIGDVIVRLNDLIEQHYDMIWQTDWYEFYELCVTARDEVQSLDVGDEAIAAADDLMSAADQAGDAPTQEQWFRICEATCDLCIELASCGAIPTEILRLYTGFYFVH